MGAADRMRQLGEEATPEPWVAEDEEQPEGWWIDSHGPTSGALHPAVCVDRPTAEFITAARNSWDAIRSVVDAVETFHGAWLFDDEGERVCICGRVDCDERVALVELQAQLERGT